MYATLKKMREEQGYTLNDIAKVINKSPCNYYKKENGSVVISVSEAIKIADFLKSKVEIVFKQT